MAELLLVLFMVAISVGEIKSCLLVCNVLSQLWCWHEGNSADLCKVGWEMMSIGIRNTCCICILWNLNFEVHVMYGDADHNVPFPNQSVCVTLGAGIPKIWSRCFWYFQMAKGWIWEQVQMHFSTGQSVHYIWPCGLAREAEACAYLCLTLLQSLWKQPASWWQWISVYMLHTASLPLNKANPLGRETWAPSLSVQSEWELEGSVYA